MAAIVLGIGTTQGAMLSTPPDDWGALARADRAAPSLTYRGTTYAWDALNALRRNAFAMLNTPEAQHGQARRSQSALAALAAELKRAAPDVLLIIGDDGNGETYPQAPGLAAVVDDCARRERVPVVTDHASGFVARRLLGDRPVPLARLRFDPFTADAEHCFALGAALGHALRGWGDERRVAVIACGGMSHPVIDEELDRRLLEGFAAGDPALVIREPEAMFRAGTAGVKNWIVAAGALDHAGLDMVLLDYVPCVRTEAGTGHAMAFAVWS